MSTLPTQLAYVGLGANLGDARGAMAWAWQRLQSLGPARISSLYKTAPIDSSGPDYLNAVAEVQTTLAPQALLAQLLSWELQQGRERPYRNAPRTLDLDLLWMDGVVLDTPVLTLPHPRLHQRAFVLAPLLELIPEAEWAPWGRLAPHLSALAEQGIERLGPL